MLGVYKTLIKQKGRTNWFCLSIKNLQINILGFESIMDSHHDEVVELGTIHESCQ